MYLFVFASCYSFAYFDNMSPKALISLVSKGSYFGLLDNEACCKNRRGFLRFRARRSDHCFMSGHKGSPSVRLG